MIEAAKVTSKITYAPGPGKEGIKTKGSEALHVRLNCILFCFRFGLKLGLQ